MGDRERKSREGARWRGRSRPMERSKSGDLEKGHMRPGADVDASEVSPSQDTWHVSRITMG
eukprot:2807940-Pleurochrysis_carterae.AAC.1